MLQVAVRYFRTSLLSGSAPGGLSLHKTFSITFSRHFQQGSRRPRPLEPQSPSQSQPPGVSVPIEPLKKLKILQFSEDPEEETLENWLHRIYFASTPKEAEELWNEMLKSCPQPAAKAYSAIISVLLSKNADGAALKYLLEVKEKNIALKEKAYRQVIMSPMIQQKTDLVLYFLEEMVKHNYMPLAKHTAAVLTAVRRAKAFDKIAHIWDILKERPNVDLNATCYELFVNGIYYASSRPNKEEEIYQIYQEMRKRQLIITISLTNFLLRICMRLNKNADVEELLNTPCLKETVLPLSISVTVFEAYAHLQRHDDAKKVFEQNILNRSVESFPYTMRILKPLVDLGMWTEGAEFVKKLYRSKIEMSSEIIELCVVILCQANLVHVADSIIQSYQSNVKITPYTYQLLSSWHNKVGNLKKAHKYSQLSASALMNLEKK
jgi:hypothetical protein